MRVVPVLLLLVLAASLSATSFADLSQEDSDGSSRWTTMLASPSKPMLSKQESWGDFWARLKYNTQVGRCRDEPTSGIFKKDKNGRKTKKQYSCRAFTRRLAWRLRNCKNKTIKKNCRRSCFNCPKRRLSRKQWKKLQGSKVETSKKGSATVKSGRLSVTYKRNGKPKQFHYTPNRGPVSSSRVQISIALKKSDLVPKYNNMQWTAAQEEKWEKKTFAPVKKRNSKRKHTCKMRIGYFCHSEKPYKGEIIRVKNALQCAIECESRPGTNACSFNERKFACFVEWNGRGNKCSVEKLIKSKDYEQNQFYAADCE
jgi:hypothetical protein